MQTLPLPHPRHWPAMRRAWPEIVGMRARDQGAKRRGVFVVEPGRVTHVPVERLDAGRLRRRGLGARDAEAVMESLWTYLLTDHAPILVLEEGAWSFHLWRSLGD